MWVTRYTARSYSTHLCTSFTESHFTYKGEGAIERGKKGESHKSTEKMYDRTYQKQDGV